MAYEPHALLGPERFRNAGGEGGGATNSLELDMVTLDGMASRKTIACS